MTRYITWPKDIDEAFRADYASIVGETVQQSPQETTDGQWCVGSARITPEQAATLMAAHSDITVSSAAPEMMIVEE